MLLILEPQWRDHDGMLKLRFSIEGSGYAAEITFYCYPETIETFGRTLGDFPRSSTDEAHASFVSTAIRQGANGNFAVTGTLTIRGKSATVVVPMQYRKDGVAQVFDRVLPIRRLQYGIGQGEWADTSLVADDVQLKFHLIYNGR
jgi:hypothetical protein